MAHSASDLTVVLVDLDANVHRASSCACPGAASRVIVLDFLLDRRPYTSSRVWLMGDRKLHSGRRGNVPLGMALQFLNLRHSDGHVRTGLGMAKVMEKTRSAGLTSWHRPGRALSCGHTPF
jgi:hypothetical protein